MFRPKLIAFAAAAAFALTAGPATASMTPDAPWSATGTATTTVTSDGTLVDPSFDYAVAGTSGAWTFSATAKTSRSQPITWHYKGYHAWFGVRVGIERFV